MKTLEMKKPHFRCLALLLGLGLICSSSTRFVNAGVASHLRDSALNAETGGEDLPFGVQATASETEPNNTPATATPLPALDPCAMISGAVSPAADVDYFSFPASAGDQVWINIDTGGPTTGNSRTPHLRLIGTDGVVILGEDVGDGTGNGCDDTIETPESAAIAGTTLTSTGTHFIWISTASAGTTIDPYTLFVVVTSTGARPEDESNDTAGTANFIIPGGQQVGLRSGDISPASDVDYYSLLANAGDTLFIAADGDRDFNSIPMNLVLELRDSSDALILSVDSSGSGTGFFRPLEAFCFTVTSSGTYFIKVRHRFDDDIGDYDLMVANCTSSFSFPPVVQCRNVTKSANNACRAIVMPSDVDHGSFDPDGGPITLSLTPAGPFPLGMTVVTLTVTDDENMSSQCTAIVTVTNTPPVVNAGPDQAVDESTIVTLKGSGSDPDPGQAITFQWMQTGGPAVTLTGANTIMPTFTAPAVADGLCTTLTFQLKVTDSCGVVSSDTVVVKVNDVFVLQDESTGNCLRLRPCEGSYCWRASNGHTYSGSAVLTFQGTTTLNLIDGPNDPNTLQGVASLVQRRGNARLTVPGVGTFTIVDNNIDNSSCVCP